MCGKERKFIFHMGHVRLVRTKRVYQIHHIIYTYTTFGLHCNTKQHQRNNNPVQLTFSSSTQHTHTHNVPKHTHTCNHIQNSKFHFGHNLVGVVDQSQTHRLLYGVAYIYTYPKMLNISVNRLIPHWQHENGSRQSPLILCAYVMIPFFFCSSKIFIQTTRKE